MSEQTTVETQTVSFAFRERRALAKMARGQDSPNIRGMSPIEILAMCAESAGLALIAADSELSQSLTYHARVTGNRMVLAYGDRLNDVESETLRFAAYRLVGNPAMDRGKLVSRCVRDAARYVIRQYREMQPSRSTSTEAPIATFATWSPSKRIERAGRYTSADFTKLDLTTAETLADSVLVARQVCPSLPRIDRIGGIGGTVHLPGSAPSSAPSAERDYWSTLTQAALYAASIAVFGDQLPELHAAYRPERLARKGSKKSGRKVGDITRGRYVSWKEFDPTRAPILVARDVKRELARMVTLAAEIMERPNLLPARAIRRYANVPRSFMSDDRSLLAALQDVGPNTKLAAAKKLGRKIERESAGTPMVAVRSPEQFGTNDKGEVQLPFMGEGSHAIGRAVILDQRIADRPTANFSPVLGRPINAETPASYPTVAHVLRTFLRSLNRPTVQRSVEVVERFLESGL